MKLSLNLSISIVVLLGFTCFPSPSNAFSLSTAYSLSQSFVSYVMQLFGGSHTGHTDPAYTTRITILPSTIRILGQTYQRYRLDGEGVHWRDNQDGMPVLWMKRGETLSIKYENLLDEPELIHMHGLRPPYTIDGVPYVQSNPIQSGHSLVWTYTPNDSGTRFLHSHYGFHHDLGVSMPIIIADSPPLNYPLTAELTGAQDVVLMIEDFCASNINDKNGDPTCFNPMAAYTQLAADWKETRNKFNFSECQAPGTQMDVKHLTHIINFRTAHEPVHTRVNAGEYVRLRIINSASMVNYAIRLGQLSGQLVAVDGNWIHPLSSRSIFWLAPAQRLDILVRIPGVLDTFPIFAQEEGVAGARGQAAFVLVSQTGKYEKLSFPTHASSPIEDMGLHVGVQQEIELRAWKPLADKPIDRQLFVRLTGDNGFQGINQRSYQLPPLVPVHSFVRNPSPLYVREGERVCIQFTNYNADAHPMHLHGHTFEVVEIDGHRINGAKRDTLLVPKGSCRTATICFDANNAGIFPLHCHMNYHMMAGMFTTIEYEAAHTNTNPDPDPDPDPDSDSAADGKQQMHTMSLANIFGQIWRLGA